MLVLDLFCSFHVAGNLTLTTPNIKKMIKYSDLRLHNLTICCCNTNATGILGPQFMVCQVQARDK